MKGFGGYHLACNALDHDAVQRLRAKKHREEKPFALMARDLKAVKQLCLVSDEDEILLRSYARPIVLLRRRHKIQIAESVAPGQRQLGVMLPYTPLHHLLLADAEVPLVMTSGNMSEEPIAYKDDDALCRLGKIAEYFLVHDREIHMRCDDSVARTIGKQEVLIRRSRGYVPQPISVAVSFVQPVLACGAHLKNTFCLGKERHAFMSHHIGDLENYETWDSFTKGIEHFKNLFTIEPSVVAHDLHPEYLSTKYARGVDGLTKIGVQHHHAHIAGCMAEHGLEGPVIGVAFDGLGYGADGTIWGGEFLVAKLSGYARRAAAYCPSGRRQSSDSRALANGGELSARCLRHRSDCFRASWLGQNSGKEDRDRYVDDAPETEHGPDVFLRTAVRRRRFDHGFTP